MASRNELAELYISILGRAPDAAGLDYWLADLARGVTLEQIGANWMNAQPEVSARYQGLGFDEFVTAIYQNVLGRDPDTPGLEYWLPQVESGTIPREVFVNAIIAGAKAPSGGASDAALLSNRTEIGLQFASLNINVGTLAADVIKLATADPASVTLAQAVLTLLPAAASSSQSSAISNLTTLIDSLATTVASNPSTLAGLTIYINAVSSQLPNTINPDLAAVIAAASTIASNVGSNPALIDNAAELAETTVTAPDTITQIEPPPSTGEGGGSTGGGTAGGGTVGGGGSGGGTIPPVTQSVWANELASSAAQPATLSASNVTLTLKVDPRFGGYVSVNGFGSDDVLQLPSGAEALLSVASASGDVSLITNYNGIVSHIQLNGIVSGSALIYDTPSFNALPAGNVTFNGSQYAAVTSNLDVAGGSLGAPSQIDAAIGAFAFTDSASTSNVAYITGFGTDDSLRFTGVSSASDIAVSSQGGNVSLSVNKDGTLSAITLVGVANAGQIIHDLASFNALPIGDILF